MPRPKNPRRSVFDMLPGVTIRRMPPPKIGEGENITQYDAIITELEGLYTDMVRNADDSVEKLEKAMNDYSSNIDRLFGELAVVFTQNVQGSSGTGGAVQEHQDALRQAALKEQQRVIKAKTEQTRMQIDLGML